MKKQKKTTKKGLNTSKQLTKNEEVMRLDDKDVDRIAGGGVVVMYAVSDDGRF